MIFVVYCGKKYSDGTPIFKNPVTIRHAIDAAIDGDNLVNLKYLLELNAQFETPPIALDKSLLEKTTGKIDTFGFIYETLTNDNAQLKQELNNLEYVQNNIQQYNKNKAGKSLKFLAASVAPKKDLALLFGQYKRLNTGLLEDFRNQTQFIPSNEDKKILYKIASVKIK